ncbi:MAG TPA: hypothetical protein PKL15_14050 [Saprospiraceae bacterium]|nr:hypothetical protein [Saprospiraceae bacterium]
MKPQNFLRSLAFSGFFLHVDPSVFSQNCETPPTPGKAPDSTKETHTAVRPTTSHNELLQNWDFNGGQLTLPFKIRKETEKHTFRLTTDVTIGGYIGAQKKLSEKRNYRLLVPLAAGLTFINLENDHSTLDLEQAAGDVVPGITWGSGLILQLGDCNIGLVFGKDYASGVGDDWQYNRKWWWSFAIGYSFTGGNARE